jgi:GT2 family glycosyltransferase
MKVACIFLCWNNPEKQVNDSIGRLLQFVSPQSIIVVDNGSTNHIDTYIEQKYPDVALYRLPINTGFSAGNNVGIKTALERGFDAVCLLNVDTIIDEDFIGPCAQVLQAHADIGVIGPVVLEAYQDRVVQCEGGRVLARRANFPYRKVGAHFKRSDELVDVGYVLGAAMMIRSDVIRKIGYLEEDYAPLYLDDGDYCYRTRKAGYRSVIHGGLAIRHIGAQSSGGEQKAFRRLSTNRFQFAIKYLGPGSFLVASIAIVARVMYWKCRAALIKRYR